MRLKPIVEFSRGLEKERGQRCFQEFRYAILFRNRIFLRGETYERLAIHFAIAFQVKLPNVRCLLVCSCLLISPQVLA